MTAAGISVGSEFADSNSLSSTENASSLLPVLTSVDTGQLDSIFQSDAWAAEPVSIGSLSASTALNTDPASFSAGGIAPSILPDPGSGGSSGSGSASPGDAPQAAGGGVVGATPTTTNTAVGTGAGTAIAASTGTGTGTGIGTGSGSGSLAPEIEVTGFNFNIPDGDTTPDTSDGTDFGTGPVNTEVVRTFTVKNTGTATLTLGSPTLTSGFTLGTDTLLPSIPVEGSDTFDVKFSSATPGTYTAQLSFINNDSDENPYTFTIMANVSVSGTPEIEVLGNSNSIADGDSTPDAADGTDFGTTSVNAVTSQTFTVKNTGTATLTLETPSLPPNFWVGPNTLVGSLVAGGIDTFDVYFSAAAAGTYSGPLVISNNDSNKDPYNFDIRVVVNGTPEIEVTGYGMTIVDGDNTPGILDGTDFGTVELNTLISRTFTVKNAGTETLTLQTPSLPSGFTLGSDTLVASLAVGASDTFVVNFSSATAWTYSGQITISNNDSDEDPYNFDIIAVAADLPEINVTGIDVTIVDGDTTPSISDGTDFGSMLPGAFVSHTFTVSNTGTGWLYLGTPSITGGFKLGSDTLVTSLGPGVSDTFSVNFSSTTATTFNGQVSITNNDSDESPYNFALKAVVTGNPEIDVFGNGASIVDGDSTPNTTDGTDFGNVVPGSTISQTFTVMNTGNATLYLGSVYLTGVFSQGSDPLVTSLAPGASDTFSVNFSSSVAAIYTGQVSFSNNDSDESPYNFIVKAVVFAPEMDVYGNGVSIVDGDTTPNTTDGTDFGSVVPSVVVTHTFTVMNSGTDWLYLGTPTMSGGFSPGSDHLVTNLVPGASDTFTVNFSSATPGTYTSTVTINNNDSDESPFDFAVKAIVPTSPEMAVAGNGQSIANGDSTPSPSDDTDFGSILPGAFVSRTFTVSNTGTGWLYLGTPSITGGFTLGSDTLVTSLGPGAADTFSVNFSSTTATTFNGQVSITNNDSDESPYNFALKAVVTGNPEIDVFGNGASIVDGDSTPNTTDGTDFGNVVPGSTISQTFTVMNTGNATLYLGSVYLTGVFSQGSDPLVTSLAPGASDTFSVNFSSSVAAIYTGQVSFSNNDSDESPYNFIVKAVVIAPEMDVYGNDVSIVDGDTTPSTTDGTDFGDVVAGPTVTRTFTVTNTGTAWLYLGTPTMSGGFSLGNDHLVTSLAPGASDTFSVDFSSTTGGTSTSTVTINNNDSNEQPFDFDVTATALAPEIVITGKSSHEIASGSTNPNLIDGTFFGTLPLNTWASQVFTITNTGNAVLNLTSLSVLGSGFIALANSFPVSLGPNQFTSFTVGFLSSYGGPAWGQVLVDNNDANESPYNFTVNAMVTANPEITITATDANASEAGPDTGTYTFSRTGDSSAALTVNFNVTGTATSGTDYTMLGASVTFAANQSTKTLTLTPIDDQLEEFDETAILTLATGSGYTVGSPSSATVTIADDDPAVNLRIFNGQSGPEILEAKEATQGAFTVANLNDTDGDGVIDNVDSAVLANGDGTSNEVDLMKLIISKPANPPAGANLILTVVSGSVALWRSPSKGTAVPLVGGVYTIATDSMAAAGETVWVEATDWSLIVGDIVLKLTYSADTDAQDIVTATGIWAFQRDFINTQAATFTAAGSSGKQLKVASTAAFAKGNWVHVFSGSSWFHAVIVDKDPPTNTLLLDRDIPSTYPADKVVLQGYPKEVDNEAMLKLFEERASFYGGALADGAILGKSDFYNSMIMEFTMVPDGIGKVIKDGGTGIVVDITRQKNWKRDVPYKYELFPGGDIANDDSPPEPDPNNNNIVPPVKDEDVDFFVDSAGVVSDKIYVRDMPGEETGFSGTPGPVLHSILQHNMLEFVRMTFNSKPFDYINAPNERLAGSRASAKIPWHSQIDIIADATGHWVRNTAPGAINDIGPGPITLGP